MTATETTSSTTGVRSRRGFIAGSAAAAGALLALVCVIRMLLHRKVLGVEWHYYSLWMWIVGADLAVLTWLLLWYRPRPGLFSCGAALLPHLLVLGTAGLLALQQFDAVALWGLELLVCGALAAGWLIVIGGLAALPIGLAVRLRQGRGTLPREWLRCWMAAAAFLGTAEAAVWMVEQAAADRGVEARLALPDRYREGPLEERPVVALGGSTMLGFPYQPQISIPVVLAESLRVRRPADPDSITNLAETGVNFRRAADRLRRVEIRPRLLLLYTGNNEYFYDLSTTDPPPRWPRRLCDPLLQWSGAYRWLVGWIPRGLEQVQLEADASIIRHPLLTAEAIRRRHEQFRADLRALADHCRRHEMPTLWFLPAASEGIFGPNRSVSRRVLSSREDRVLNERYRQCRRLIEQGAYEKARRELSELCVQHPEVAELEFRMGVCLRELGQIDEARRWFRRSVDDDHQPASVNSAYRAIIAEVAGEFGIEVIDAEAVLRGISPTGLLDRHVIHDNVHPTLRGYYELGQAALRSRTVAEVFALQPPAPGEVLSFEELLRRRTFSAADLARACERTAFCYRTLARMRTDGSERMACAEKYQRWADQLALGEIEPGEEGTEAYAGDAVPGVRFD